MIWGIIFLGVFLLSRSRMLFPFCLLIAALSEYLFEVEATSLLTGPKVSMAAVVTGFLTWHRGNWSALRDAGLLLACFVFYAISSLAWTALPAATNIRVISAVLLMVMYLIVLLFAHRPEDVLSFHGALVAYGFADAVFVIVRRIQGISFVQEGLGEERYTGIGANPNETAFTLAIALCVVLAGSIFKTGHKTWFNRPILNQAVIAVISAAILLTGSRGGTLAAILGVVILVLNSRGLSANARNTLLSLFSAGVVIVGTAVQFPEAFGIIRERSGMTVEDRFGGRLDIYEFYWDLLWERPFTGHGLGVAAELVGRRHGIIFAPHSTPLNVAVELGLIGLSLAFAYVVWLYSSLRRAAGTRDVLTDRLVVGAQALCAIVVAYGISADLIQNKGAWVVAALVAATIGIARRGGPPMRGLMRPPPGARRRIC